MTTQPAPDIAPELARRYDSIAYAAQAHAQTHPAFLASVATLRGLTPPQVATCRVLEIGCADGANLLPMAMGLPEAHFIGCDLSGQSITAATRHATDLGLSNVTFLQQDLRGLDATSGTFDYIIAHGFYSWVPEAVREALLALASARLSPSGLLYMSYNTYPGCHIRQATWEILHAHVDHLPTARERIDAARALAAVLAEPGLTQTDADAALRSEFAKLARETDSALFHDDLAPVNQPFPFRDVAAALERHGLAFVAETKLSMMTPAGLSPGVAQLIAGMDLLAREQYLDFARLRRFRQSVVSRGEAPVTASTPEALTAGMHVAATMALVRAVAEGRAFAPGANAAAPNARATRDLLAWLVECAPRSVPVPEVVAWHAPRTAGTTRSTAALLVDACYAGMVDLQVLPPTLADRPSPRPLASPLVRWQLARQPGVTNLRHETLRIDDPLARELLLALDGTRTHDELATLAAARLPPAERGAAPARVATYLSHFALHGLLRA